MFFTRNIFVYQTRNFDRKFFKTILIIFAVFGLCLSFCNQSLASSYSSRVWSSVEYLHWWPQDSPVNTPLITKNNNPAALGFINEPGTQIIFGRGSSDDALNFDGMNGARVTLGSWIDDVNRYGVEGSGFGFPKAKSSFSASSVGDQIPVINIPFFDTLSSTENALVDRHPNTATATDSFQPWGIELNGLYNLSNQVHFPLILVTGFRYIDINEDFTLNDAIFELPFFPNSVINVRDNFSTKNHFYGLQVGARTNFVYDKLIVDVATSLSLGENFEKLIINGQINENNNRVLQSSGLFAEPSNIGSFHHSQFAIVPELRAKIGYHLTQHIIPFIAYNFIFINHILRPGDQIDRNINKSQNSSLGGTGVLSGPSVPSPQFNQASIWMQGVSAGVDINF